MTKDVDVAARLILSGADPDAVDIRGTRAIAHLDENMVKERWLRMQGTSADGLQSESTTQETSGATGARQSSKSGKRDSCLVQ